MILHVSPNLGILFLDAVYQEIIELTSLITGSINKMSVITPSMGLSGVITGTISRKSVIENEISVDGKISNTISLKSKVL